MLSQSPLTVCPVVYFGNTVQQVEKNLLRTAEYGSIKKHLISSWAGLLSKNCCW